MSAVKNALTCDHCGIVVDPCDGWTDGNFVFCGSLYGNGCDQTEPAKIETFREWPETCAQCATLVAPNNVQWAMATPFCPPCFMGNH